MAALPELSGQARRVAKRFALVSAAELAAPITGLPIGVGMAGVKQCFDEWLERNGTGKFEDERILENAIAFAQRYFDSNRFVMLPTNTTFPIPNDFAGYRKKGDKAEMDSFYIVPAVFAEEICKNFDKGKVCSVLHEAQWLQHNETGSRWQHQLKGRGRFFLIYGVLPPSEMID